MRKSSVINFHLLTIVIALKNRQGNEYRHIHNCFQSHKFERIKLLMKARGVGIVGIEIYFPRVYVSQEELETFDGVSKGKYTIGLGQDNLSFAEPYEDVNSMALTVTKQLLEKYRVDTRKVGRVEVGTETFVDRSKSTKTVVMQLFDHGDIEGVTSVNACYGGTNALFNTINWMQSDVWDGRLGIVICVDIAVYAKGPARPSGGAGAVALLIGPDAPLEIDVVRSTFIKNEYDFYKPDPRSEYPTVDGQLSIKTYLGAIDECYAQFQRKYLSRYGLPFSLDSVRYCCFHAPFFKMVQKSFYRLVQLDSDKLHANGPKISESHLGKISSIMWDQKGLPSTYLGKQLGNIYTGSLYAGLASLIHNGDLCNQQILMFSYGSGLAASMFLIKGRASTTSIAANLQIESRLKSRVKVSPEEYARIMLEREQAYGTLKEGPLRVNLDRLFEGTYYVSNIDAKWKRTYTRLGQLTPNQTSSNDDKLSLLRDQFINEIQIQAQTNTHALARNQYNKLWAGFYKKTVQQRLDQLETVAQVDVSGLKTGGLSLQNADLMVENCIGKVSVPMGLGLNFLINGKYYTVPMAIEEPSVIAGASSAAKLIADSSEGFTAFSSRPVMMGQIQLVDVDDPERVKCIIDKHRLEIIDLGNDVATSMVKRGGGVERVEARALQGRQMSIDVYVNVCQSMGANLVNTVVEYIAPYISKITGHKTGLRILTNYCLERRVSVSFSIPVEKMGWKNASGRSVCDSIMLAQSFADNDTYRAVTNNKGILNGIQAVALATGQDCRAINSSLHAYACKDGRYRPLAHYSIEFDQFKGTLSVPISVGTQGGAIPSNPVYGTVMEILQTPDAQQLAEIMVCVGLASNLAALRALCVEGIQKGHMNLHARNLAIASGVPAELVEEAVRFMKNRGRLRKETADEFQMAYKIYRGVRQHTESKKRVVLSTFSGEFNIPGLTDRVDLHVVFDCGSDEPIHVNFSDKDEPFGNSLRAQIFGAKGYEWLQNLLMLLQQVRLDYELEPQPLPSKTLAYKLKILSILINLIAYNMISLNSVKAKEIIVEICQQVEHPNIHDLNSLLVQSELPLRYGLNLLCELVRIFKYNLDQQVTEGSLKKVLLDELMNIITSHVKTFELWENVKQSKYDMNAFWNARKKRLSCTMMLLCDSLNLTPGKLTQETLNTILALGDIYEVEITIARDSSKWKQSNNVMDPNVYSYWLLEQNCFFLGMEPSLMIKFIEESTTMLNTKRQLLEPQLSPQMKHLSDRATQVVKQYYNLKVTPKL